MEEVKAVVWLIIGAVIGGLIELAAAIVFEAPFRNYYRRARRMWLLFIEAVRGTNRGMEREHYRIGDFTAPVMILEGTPNSPYEPDRVNCHLFEEPLKLPQELEIIKKNTEREQELIAQDKGRPDFHNGAMTALVNYHHSYTQVWEDPTLFLQLKETDYYTFLSTALKLDTVIPTATNPSETLRAKYLGSSSYRTPNPNFATSFGVNLTIVTDDEYLIITRRGETGVSHYHGAYAVPVMESVNPKLDRDVNQQLDIFETARRGLHEEFGIHDVAKESIKLFTLQVDTRHYLYGFTGFFFAEGYSRDLTEGIRSRGVRDWWESPEHTYVQFNPRSVAKFVKDHGGVARFHPTSFVSICQSLIYRFGQRETNNAFKE